MSNILGLSDIELNIPSPEENVQLPNPDLLDYYKDMKNRIIWIDYEIDESLDSVSKAILEYNRIDKDVPVEDRKPIKLFIHTYGGDVASTIHLMDVISLSKTPIYTYNMGNALSADFQILISGHKRFCLPNSRALYHSGSGSTSGTFEQTQAQMKEYNRLISVFEKNTLEKTKIDSKLFAKNKSKEWYMDSNEQLQYGIVDALITDVNDLL